MTILVGIPSYRDPELCQTLRDCLDKALFPERVKIAVVEQNDPADPFDCHARNAAISPFQIKVMTLHYKEAQGAPYARYLLQKLWDGEDFFFGLDSHIRFEKGWDCLFLDEIFKCKRPYRSILTLYPSPFHIDIVEEGQEFKKDPTPYGKRPPKLYKDSDVRVYTIPKRKTYRYARLHPFDSEGNLKFSSVDYGIAPKTPTYAPMIAAGCYFVYSDFLNLVPWSPKLVDVFFGEEMFLSARAFTHGFDILAPTASLVYHEWDKKYRYNFVCNETKRATTLKYIQGILSETLKDDQYGLGKIRKVKKYWDYLGVDFNKKVMLKKQDGAFTPHIFEELPPLF